MSDISTSIGWTRDKRTNSSTKRVASHNVFKRKTQLSEQQGRVYVIAKGAMHNIV
jgi:hypothetical protein